VITEEKTQTTSKV